MSSSSPAVERLVDPPIDRAHLSRQTLGDRDLEREILSLFVRQSVMLGKRIEHSVAGSERRDLAHTLNGSARAIGAWRVAEAAEAVENLLVAMAATPPKPGERGRQTRLLSARIGELASSIEEANAVIADLTPA